LNQLSKALKKRTRSLILALAIVVATAVAGAQTVTIKWADHWQDLRADGYAELIAAFEAKHPNIRVEYITGNEEAILVQIAGGIAPDIFTAGDATVGSRVRDGMALPLNEFIEKDKLNLREHFVPGALDSAYVNGVQYGLPKIYSVFQPWINLDYLDEAALPVPQRGWTLSDFEEYMRVLTIFGPDGEVVRHGTTRPRESLSWWFVNGGHIVDPESHTAAFTEPAFLDTIAWLGNLTKSGYAGVANHVRNVQGFRRGDTAMTEDGRLAFAPRLADPNDSPSPYRIQTIYMPQGNTPDPVTAVRAHQHLIYSGTQHPAEAWEFLKFINLSPEAHEIRARYGIPNGTIEGLRMLVEHAPVAEAQDRMELYGVFMQPTSYTPETYAVQIPGYHEVSLLVMSAVDRVLDGEVDAAVALHEIVDAANAVLRSAKEH